MPGLRDTRGPVWFVDPGYEVGWICAGLPCCNWARGVGTFPFRWWCRPGFGVTGWAVGSFLGLARPGQHFLQGNSPTFVGCTGPVYTPHQTRAAQREQGLRDCTPVKIFTGGNAYGIGEQQKGEHCIYNNRMREKHTGYTGLTEGNWYPLGTPSAQ